MECLGLTNCQFRPSNIPSKTIGKNRVAVPAYFYKIVFDPDANDAIAFIMPNKKLKSFDMPNYIVAISDVEQKTGLTFLTEPAPSKKKAGQSKKAGALWP